MTLGAPTDNGAGLHAYQAAGNADLAVILFEQAVDAVVRTLGEDHPLTRTVRGNLTAAVIERDYGIPPL